MQLLAIGSREAQRRHALFHSQPFLFLLVDCCGFLAGVVREACRERGQIRLTFTAGTGEENKPRAEDR